MKRIIFWVIPLALLFSACQKDVLITDRTDTDAARLGRDGMYVKTPLKCNFYAIPDLTQGFIACTPVEYGVMLAKHLNIGGSASHFGELNMSGSFGTTTMCNLGPLPGQITLYGNGQIMADNGDIAYYTSSNVTNTWDMTFTGPVTMTGGTGRFEGCTGEVMMTGYQDVNTGMVYWTAEGYLMMKKK